MPNAFSLYIKSMNTSSRTRTEIWYWKQLLTMDRCRSLEFLVDPSYVDGSIKHQNRRSTFPDVQPFHFAHRLE